MKHSPLLAEASDKVSEPKYKEPTGAMRIKEAAKSEKIHATRRWIAGEISTKQHSMIHKRAAHAIKNAHKLGKH